MPHEEASYKRLKDPIYGYISIDKARTQIIIDSSAFQRLRHISQTSYTPLYSAALHNRFIHSIGVYHLGTIALASLKKNISKDGNIARSLTPNMEDDFLNACLLHDIGHSPFSHSGENFYFEKGGGPEDPLLTKLKEAVGSAAFDTDINSIVKLKAAAHEVMSALEGITVFGSIIHDKEFFTRCITGYVYSAADSIDMQIKNVMIQLLNSSFIDVDKVDYLLRDAFVTGYDTISIDYERLFCGIEVKEIDGKYELVFNKSTLSVLENVVYAHDSERKWIQTHPVVLYEAFIIQYAIKKVKQYYADMGLNLFSLDALLGTGATALQPSNSKFRHISLLCDDDIIYTMKNEMSDNLINEYFDRSKRRHAIWKSEAEFKILFDNMQGTDAARSFNGMLAQLEKFLKEDCDRPLLDDDAVLTCDKMLEKINSNDKSKKEEELIKRYHTIKKNLQKFKGFAEKLEIPFDFAIIEAKRFASNFSKEALGNLLIDFPDLPKPRKLSEVDTLLKADNPKQDKFYYIYYRRDTDFPLSLVGVGKTLKEVFSAPVE